MQTRLPRQYRLFLLVLTCSTGCAEWYKTAEPVSPRPKGTMSDLAAFTSEHTSAATEGTIRAITNLQGDRLMKVRGYGLVVGVPGKGGRNCLPSVREYLIREINRARLANPHAEYPMTAEQLINSPDSAVVEVVGDIPAGASRGQSFDVVVSSASFDPDTESIAGGYLLTCDLKVFRETPQEIIEGQSLARAHGPIFVNPFVGGDNNAAGVNPREGKVLAGGVVTEDRKLSLISVMDSYSTVSQIQTAINRMFPSDPKAADAISATMVNLRIPPEYRGREARYLELISHLALEPSAAAKEVRGKRLVAELTRPDAPLEDVALALEGLGTPGLSLVKGLYTHSRREVNYYAARTGLRLGDALALEVMARHAKDDKSPFRAAAIRELGACKWPVPAGAVLRELLNQSDPRIQILAYEALRSVDPDSVTTRVVGHEPENFILDVVPSDGPMLIYARRTRTRRIALIGGDRLVLQPPMLYAEDGKPLLVSAGPNDKFISIIKKNRKGEPILGPLKVGTSLPKFVHFLGNDPKSDLFGQLQGLGIDYAVVLDVLHRFYERGAVDADFRWEEPGIEDLVGPLKPVGRPESEL